MGDKEKLFGTDGVRGRANEPPMTAENAMALGQAIGRWGNFLNQELYGKPTDLPWGIRIDNPPASHRPPIVWR